MLVRVVRGGREGRRGRLLPRTLGRAGGVPGRLGHVPPPRLVVSSWGRSPLLHPRQIWTGQDAGLGTGKGIDKKQESYLWEKRNIT